MYSFLFNVHDDKPTMPKRPMEEEYLLQEQREALTKFLSEWEENLEDEELDW